MLQSSFRSVQQLAPVFSRLSLASTTNTSKNELDILKRSPTPMNLFTRHKMEHKDKNMKVTQYMKVVGQEWKSLSDSDKKPFVVEAEKLKKERERQLQVLPEEKLFELQKLQSEQKAKLQKERQVRKANKAFTLTDAPKHPLSPFFQFNMAEMKKLTKPLQKAEMLAHTSSSAAKWRNMSAQEKEKYEKEYERQKAELPEHVKAWQDKTRKAFGVKEMYTAMQRPRMTHLILEGQEIPAQFLLLHKEPLMKKVKASSRKVASAKKSKVKATVKKTTSKK